MKNCGQDLMKYLSKMAEFRRRLETANHPVTDSKSQRVLLHGLQGYQAFENFILMAKRIPYNTYNDLVRALQEYASEPLVLDKLLALKPGNPQAILTTRESTAEPSAAQRLDRLESMLVSLAEATTNKQPCRDLRRGNCQRGDACPYSHASNTNNKMHVF